MTQKEMIKSHLLSGLRITPLSALNQFGCFRLATRIFELKKEGMDIVTEIITHNVTRKRYACYHLRREGEK